MTLIRPSLAQKKYPIRYWIFVAYAVGVPNFVRFDGSGRTHEFGLFNPTSISNIILTLTCAFLFASVTVLGRRRILLRRVDFSAWLWIALLILLTIASLLQPSSPNRAPVASDLPLSLYRLGEWILGFILLLSLYTREDEDRAMDLIIRLIGAVCWINIAIVWIVLPIAPSLVYAAPEDIGEGNARLGGALIHPVHLSVLAGVGFFYALFFFQGRKKFFGCFITTLTLVMTYARSEQIVFLIAVFAYLMVLSRKFVLRMLGFSAICSIAAGAIVFQEKILDYLERGQGMRNITTLSERTDVWKASFRAFWLRPYIGYGYISGVKQALRDQWNATNWIPPHSHSEFVQALVSSAMGRIPKRTSGY
jgi:O-antigen ligase